MPPKKMIGPKLCFATENSTYHMYLLMVTIAAPKNVDFSCYFNLIWADKKNAHTAPFFSFSFTAHTVVLNNQTLINNNGLIYERRRNYGWKKRVSAKTIPKPNS